MIENKFPEKYDIQFFNEIEELKPNSAAIVVLHPDSYGKEKVIKVRQYECVYMMGKTSNVPPGSIRITQHDLFQLLE